mmetsp:Transcript_22674/g.72948  ORF Transcript_22674/g.72948 Transcript_22674/m.72948 type:complete len:201 (-) Transcript_22674:830-1432(-)
MRPDDLNAAWMRMVDLSAMGEAQIWRSTTLPRCDTLVASCRLAPPATKSTVRRGCPFFHSSSVSSSSFVSTSGAAVTHWSITSAAGTLPSETRRGLTTHSGSGLTRMKCRTVSGSCGCAATMPSSSGRCERPSSTLVSSAHCTDPSSGSCSYALKKKVRAENTSRKPSAQGPMAWKWAYCGTVPSAPRCTSAYSCTWYRS